MRNRVLVVAVTVVLAGTAVACGRPDTTLTELVAALPADLAESGVLLRRGGDGAQVLAGQLGVGVDRVDAHLQTTAPAVRLLATGATDPVADRLTTAGFRPVTAPTGWRVLVRPDGLAGYVGVPAVAVGAGLVAVGSAAQVTAVARGGPPLTIPDGSLADADVALVRGSGGGQGVPAHLAAVLTAATATTGDDDGGAPGRLVLQLPGEGTQADAVAVDVAVRTRGPVAGDGSPLLRPTASLTRGSVVGLAVVWREPPPPWLRAGLDGGLLDFLG